MKILLLEKFLFAPSLRGAGLGFPVWSREKLWGDLCYQIKVTCKDETAQARSSAGIRESAQAAAPEVGSVWHIRTEQSLCPLRGSRDGWGLMGP